jgi:mRNA interferase RelE/StbE
MASARTYRIELKPSAAKKFSKLPKSVQSRLRPRIDALATNPRPQGSIKLESELELFRIRVGTYRVI